MIEPFPPYKTIRISRKERVARLILNRPRSGNRVNHAMVEELSDVANRINQDDSLLAVVLTGSGKIFSSGWERFRIHTPQELAQFQAAAHIARIEQPVVAAVNGDAIGQGLELALAADIRIAASAARFGMPQVQSGLLPWDGGTQRLARIVGRAHATEMLLTGRIVDASEALRMGLINEVAKSQSLSKTVDALLVRILSGAPVAVRYAKETIRQGMDMTLNQGLHLEAELNILLHSTEDRSKGIRSFIERRSPVFRGR